MSSKKFTSDPQLTKSSHDSTCLTQFAIRKLAIEIPRFNSMQNPPYLIDIVQMRLLAFTLNAVGVANFFQLLPHLRRVLKTFVIEEMFIAPLLQAK